MKTQFTYRQTTPLKILGRAFSSDGNKITIARVKAVVLRQREWFDFVENYPSSHDFFGMLSENVSRIGNDVLFIDELAVLPEYRNQGIASRLLNDLIQSHASGLMIVTRPAALCFHETRAKNDFEKRMADKSRPFYDQDKNAVKEKVAAFWETQGFRRYSYNYWIYGYSGEPRFEVFSPKFPASPVPNGSMI